MAFNVYNYSMELQFGKSKTKLFLKCDVTSSSIGNTTALKFSEVTQFTVSLPSFCLHPQCTERYNIHLKIKGKTNIVKLRGCIMELKI